MRKFLLNLYYYGSYPYRWWVNQRIRLEHRAPLVVIFYHRIADDGATPWTISNRMFARQIAWLASRFKLVSLKEGQRLIHSQVNVCPCVSITFDDGYAENCHQAIPLLLKKQIPCTYFVTLRNVLEGEPFPHDLEQGKSFPPNNLDQLRAMVSTGIEVGAHGYNHIDLGQLSNEQLLYDEVVTAGKKLQEAVGKPVRYFAFPFGQRVNLNPKAFEIAWQAEYESVCTSYGGYNFPGDDPFHIQRVPADNYMIRLKNWVTIDPRKINTPRYEYKLPINSGNPLKKMGQ